MAPSMPHELSRLTLALFAGGSGDHNPLHLDAEFAKREGGFDDVIGQGMLTMAILAQYVSTLAPQDQIRSLSGRFIEPSRVGDLIVCGALVRRIDQGEDGRLAYLDLTAARADGAVLIKGNALIQLGDGRVRE